MLETHPTSVFCVAVPVTSPYFSLHNVKEVEVSMLNVLLIQFDFKWQKL